MQRWKLLAMLLACGLLLSEMALAQVTTGSILGTVRDSTGAVIPGATVRLKNLETGLERTLSTDAAGRYSASQLGLGLYEVSVEATGFQSAVRSGIELTVGREAVVDFTVQLGAVSEKVTVTGEAPLVETTNATVADLVNEKTLRDIPLNGRSVTDLTALEPGVVSNLGLATGVFQGGPRISMNGARPQQSLYLLDGTDIVSPHSNVAPASVLGQTLGVDTIREFSVLQNNYGAQYGRAIGGIVNAVTRSGTNSFHGSVFEFFRNSALDAKNFFDQATAPIPPFRRNQFGTSVGGPVVKDHTFFFFSYEGVRQTLGTTDVGTVLSSETRQGQVTGCPAGMVQCPASQRIITQTVPINPSIVPIINLMPPGNGQYLQGGLQEFLGSRTQPGRENYFMGRLDQRLSEKDTLFGRITVDNSSRELSDAQLLPGGGHPSTNDKGFYEYLSVEWTHVLSPALLNTARFGFARNNNQQCQCIPGTNQNVDQFAGLPPQLQIIPGEPFGGPWGIGGLTGISVPGGHNGPTAAGNVLGADLDDPLHFIDNTFTYFDSVRLARGRHSVDAGVDMRRYQENSLQTVWGHGQTTWADPIANFLTAGTCAGCLGISSLIVTGVTGPPDSYRGWRQWYGGWYVQDDFHVLPRLTLNLGVRWEKATAPVEVNGKAATIKDVLHDSGWTELGKSPLFQLRNPFDGLTPRFGFAYSPDQKTSVRGGFGIFKEIPLTYLYHLAVFFPPYAERVQLLNVNTFPNPLQTLNPAALSRAPLLVDYHLKYPYNYQWNFGVERQLGASWVVKAGYIGTRGLDLIGVLDQVQPALSIDAQGQPFTPRGAPSSNPFLTTTRTSTNVGNSYYNALQLRIEKRFSYGLQFSSSYTFSRNLGNIGLGLEGAEVPGASTGGFQVGNLWNFRTYDYGPLSQNAPHNFNFNYTFELPFGKGHALGAQFGKGLDLALGGWQINGNLTARSGLAENATGGGYSPTGYCRDCEPRPNLKPGGNNDPVTHQVAQFWDPSQFVPVTPGYFGNVGHNTLTGPGLTDLDFSVFKRFPVTEGKDLQFRAEFFNVLNHPNFAFITNNTVFQTSGAVSPTFGKITSTSTTSRQIQFALKFEF